MPRSPAATDPLFALTLTTSPEAEDAVAELLLRTTGQSAIITHDRIRGVSRAVAYLADASFLTSDRRKALRSGLLAIRDCGLDVAPGRISWTRVKRADWKESWKRHFKPMAFGQALLVRPSWSLRRPTKAQAELVLDPGLSFGTGQHPTTGFCLREVVRLRRGAPPPSLLDVGTGSGILALAAAKLAYHPVKAFDFDPEAVAVARENAAKNRLTQALELSRGDVAQLSIRPRRTFDVVCANLMAHLLLKHALALIAQVRPGGHLVLAGILAEEFDAVRMAYEALGLVHVRSRTQREWRSGSFRKPAPASGR